MKKYLISLLVIVFSIILSGCPIVDPNSSNNLGGEDENNNDLPTGNVKSIAVGDEYSLVLLEDGSLWGFGFNTSGQLGLRDLINNQLEATKIVDSGVLKVAASDRYSMIIKDDNTLWATGDNDKRFGNGNEDDYRIFTKIRDDVEAVSCSFSHTSIITTSGDLLTCGYNTEGQLGDSNNTHSSSWVNVTTTKDVISVSNGDNFTIFLTSDNDLYGFGNNGSGQLGQDNITDTNHPVFIKSNVESISAGDSSYGQSGSSTGYNKLPKLIFSDIKIISAGDRYSMIIKNDNTLWAAGSDSNHKQGDGDNSNSAHYSFYQVTN